MLLIICAKTSLHKREAELREFMVVNGYLGTSQQMLELTEQQLDELLPKLEGAQCMQHLTLALRAFSACLRRLGNRAANSGFASVSLDFRCKMRARKVELERLEADHKIKLEQRHTMLQQLDSCNENALEEAEATERVRV